MLWAELRLDVLTKAIYQEKLGRTGSRFALIEYPANRVYQRKGMSRKRVWRQYSG